MRSYFVGYREVAARLHLAAPDLYMLRMGGKRTEDRVYDVSLLAQIVGVLWASSTMESLTP